MVWPLLAFSILAQAQGKKKISIGYSAKEYSVAKTTPNGVINCVLPPAMLKANDTNYRLYFYAQNDLRKIPMELVYKKGKLPLNTVAVESQVIYSVSADEIFFKEPKAGNYQWKWRGRARVPASPITPVTGKEVKKVACWFVLVSNKKSYVSDTLTIAIK